MRRFLLALMAVAAAAFTFGGVALAQEAPRFKLGFKGLADMIPNVVGTPLENEHYAANGDSMQQTTTGLMVWRKADNVTAFTNGSETWLLGPDGLQERSNNERFPWETQAETATPAPAPSPTPPPTPAPSPSPAATPTPTPTPAPPAKPALQGSQPNIIQGQGLEANTDWILGEVHNVDTRPAYNVVVTAKLVSSSGSVVGMGNQMFPYLGPGDSVGYRVGISNPNLIPYSGANVSIDSSATGFASYTDVPIQWVKNEQVATKIGNDNYVEYQFSGNLNNTTSQSASLNAVYVWFLDDQNRVIWADYTYIAQRLVSGESVPFMITTPLDRDNPPVRGITQVRFYAAGQTP
jgi:hypothetical protein